MGKGYLFLIFLLFSLSGYCQLDKLKLEEFKRKIKTVKYADLGITETAMKMIVSRGVNEISDVVAIKQFINEDLKLMGTIITLEDKDVAYSNCRSITEIVNISWQAGAFESGLGAIGNYPFAIVFSFVDNSEYTFKFPVNVSGLTMSMPKAIIRGLRKSIGVIDPLLTPLKVELPSGELIYNESEINSYFEKNESKTKVEGVYKLIKGSASIDKLAIVQKNGKFYLVNIQNKYFIDDWKYGEIRGIIEPTMAESTYIGTYYLVDKFVDDIMLKIKEDNLIEISFPKGGESLTFIKLK
jgi:hypothetical protein